MKSLGFLWLVEKPLKCWHLSQTEYDLVGVATGIIDKKNIIDGSKIKNGDAVLGLPSSGLHTNGYSLARKLMFDTLKMKVNDVLPGHTATVKDVLLAPHKNYSMVINDLIIKKQSISVVHCGGGLIDNIPRILPKDLSVEIDTNSWKNLPIFEFMSKALDLKAMSYIELNMGIGLVFVVDNNKKVEI